MAYSRRIWIDDSTPLSAQNLNSLERGLELASQQAEDNASDLAGQAVTVQNLSADVKSLNNIITDKMQFNLDTITPIHDQLVEHSEDLETINSRVEDQNSCIADMTERYEYLQERIYAFESHIDNSSNPHKMTANDIDTYTKAEIDQKIIPVKEIMGDITNGTAIIELNDIGYFSHNLRLDINGSNLWDITEKTPSIATFSSQNLLADKITSLLNSEFTWQQIGSSIDATEITTDFLRSLKAFPQSVISETTGISLNFGTNLEENIHVVLDLFSESLARHYFVTLGKDRAFFIALKDNKLFIKREANSDKIIIDNIPVDLKLDTIYAKSTTTFTCTTANVEFSSYRLYLFDNEGPAASLENIYSSGTYSVPFTPTPLMVTNKFRVSGTLAGPENSSVFYVLYYLNKESSLSALNLNGIFTTEKEAIITEAKAEVSREVQKLISYGTTDPLPSTPGLVYFKYLPL